MGNSTWWGISKRGKVLKKILRKKIGLRNSKASGNIGKHAATEITSLRISAHIPSTKLTLIFLDGACFSSAVKLRPSAPCSLV